ncbi:MAG TPA: hypothetical protein VK721_06195 [Solirubrobacteraceae bacterium]|nr:hypothetical protein [Solirubrobacteraceae bacterium]
MTIAAHSLAGRWLIAARTVTVPAIDADDARRFAVRLAHAEAHVAPWKTMVRESLGHTHAERIGEKAAAVSQLEIPRAAA